MKLYPNPALLRRCGDWEFYESGNKSSVTQPAVFASIAKLEEELGARGGSVLEASESVHVQPKRPGFAPNSAQDDVIQGRVTILTKRREL